MILVAYDGSADAQAAINRAGALLRGHPAIVLTVWEPLTDALARTPGSYAGMSYPTDPVTVDDQARAAAERAAEEGAQLAREAGLDASPRLRAQAGTVAAAILAEADRCNATAIVLGSRGLTGLKSALLGSVSHMLVEHADRAVLVVPSPGVAADRREPEPPSTLDAYADPDHGRGRDARA